MIAPTSIPPLAFAKSSASLLRHLPLFNALKDDELDDLVTLFREDHYGRGDIIFHECDPASRFWLVKEGQVKIVRGGEGGREVALELLSPGEFFGAGTMLAPRQPATAYAVADTITLSLPIESYRHLLQTQPGVAVAVIELLSQRMAMMVGMRAKAGGRVESRIAHILLKLASKFGKMTDEGWMINAGLSRQDIAELADTTAETAIRVMSKLRNRNLVKTRPGGFVVILNPQELKELAES